MTIDLALLDRVTQKVVQTPTGTVLRAYDGATVLNEIALSSSKVPGEINDLMLLQRTAIAYGVDSFIGSKVNPVTGGVELFAGSEPLTIGGGGITPDATGTLAGRAAHNSAAVGFVYLATDQTPAEYYFREGAAGNWSAAVTVRGPTGATGPQGPQGIQGPAGANGTDGGFTLPSNVVTSVADTATSTLLLVEGGTAEQISVDSLVAAISTPASALAAAAALSGSDIITVSQDGGSTEVRTTLSALATFLGATQTNTVPGAPTGLVATAGNASASVSFTAPASNGGLAIDLYTVTASTGQSNSGSSSPIVVSGLTNDVSVTFTATAHNAIGDGATSLASAAVTPSAGATVPSQVTGLTLGAATSTTQPLTWTAPSNGGSAITDYVVQYALAGTGNWNTFADGTSTSASATVTGLVASTNYDFRVAAVNGIGQGTFSATGTGTTAAAGTTYTIGSYGGNATKAAINAAGLPTGYSPIAYLQESPFTLTNHWSVTPDPASCRGGWGTSNTVPPAEITAGQNGNGSASVNGLLPMLKVQANTWDADGYFWVTLGSGTSNWYYWIKPVDGPAQCMNPTAPLVVSNA